MTAGEQRADLVIVGGGVVGLAVAYYAARAGREVTLIERDQPGAATSWGNCGLITPSHADPLAQPGSLLLALRSLSSHGAPLRIAPTFDPRRLAWFCGFARRCTERHRRRARDARWALLESSLALLDELVRTEALRCAWQHDGLTTLYRSPAALEAHLEVHRLLAGRGLRYEAFHGDAVREHEPLAGDAVVGAIHASTDGHLDPGAFGAELDRLLRRQGVRVLAGTEVTRLIAGRGTVEGLETSAGRIRARQVVLAAGPWSPRLAATLGLRMPVEPGTGYSITWNAPVDGMRRPLMFWERKVVATPWPTGFRLGSTMEFRGYDARLDSRRLSRLRRGADEFLARPLELGPGREWCGWRPMCVDEIPILGPSSRFDNLHYACGHGQLGVSQSTATGRLLGELLDGQRPHLAPEPYAPGRFGL